MVRKTKEDAEITRHRIINAAREVFLTKGVGKTSLEQIATHAGVTRGAVYWHFDNKAQLFHAMREQVFLPLIDRMDDTLLTATAASTKELIDPLTIDPLTRIENFLQGTIEELTSCLQTQQTYIIMMSKCEYVDEFATVLEEILDTCSSMVKKFEHVYTEANAQGLLSTALSPAQFATDTHLFFSGLLHMWVKVNEESIYRQQAKALISAHIKLRKKQ